MEMPPLETERLVIRPMEEGDLTAVLAVLEVTGPEGEAATDRYVRHGGLNATVLSELGQPPLGDRTVVLRSTGELIGLAGLVPAFGPFDQLRLLDAEPEASERRPAMQRIEIGLYYHVSATVRGRGYATEAARALIEFAFGPMRLGRIVATTERDNFASQAVMRHVGMQMHENALDEPDWFQLVGILEHPNR